MKRIEGALGSPFALLGMLIAGITAYAWYAFFVAGDFYVFTTEQETREAIDSEFALFSEYL